MTINSNWLEKDFKQKYFLYCKDCTEISAKKVEKQKEHKQQIKITEV